jgi:protein kinase C substrate 80K-H
MGLLALMQTLDTHQKALKSLKREHDKHHEREKALGQILDTLRTGYNPNYQDMAVLEAVRGWEELAGLPHINDVGKDDEAKAQVKSKENSPEEEMEPEMWSPSQLESGLNDLVNSDHVSLLFEHEEHMQVYRGVTATELVKLKLVKLLQKLGVVSGGDSPAGEH